MAVPAKRKLETDCSNAFVKLQRELMGRGPQETKTYIVRDMVIVRSKGVLTVEENHLVQNKDGRKLVKQMRQCLREMYNKDFEKIIEELSGCQVISSHSDISTRLGERIEVFIVNIDLENELSKND